MQTCELVNLADLATETEHVRSTIAAYLEDLLSLGVDGFRIDAAKHMARRGRRRDRRRAARGDRASRRRSSGAAASRSRRSSTSATARSTSSRTARSSRACSRARRGWRSTSARPRRWVPSDQAVVFVDNHDTERNGSTLSYADGEQYALANVLMLAGSYGTPGGLQRLRVLRPRRRAAAGRRRPGARRLVRAATDPQDGDWVCQHRWPQIAGMVGWRNVVGDAPAGRRLVGGRRRGVRSRRARVRRRQRRRRRAAHRPGDEPARRRLLRRAVDATTARRRPCGTGRSPSPCRRARRRRGTCPRARERRTAPPRGRGRSIRAHAV